MGITKYVKEWFARADEDLYIAELVLKEKGPPNQICFHAQQAAEKILKGFLAFREIHIRKIHDLDNLVQTCIEKDASFEEIKKDAIYLTQFYITARYPADMPEFSHEDGKRALKAALDIKKFVLEKVGT